MRISVYFNYFGVHTLCKHLTQLSILLSGSWDQDQEPGDKNVKLSRSTHTKGSCAATRSSSSSDTMRIWVLVVLSLFRLLLVTTFIRVSINIRASLCLLLVVRLLKSGTRLIRSHWRLTRGVVILIIPLSLIRLEILSTLKRQNKKDVLHYQYYNDYIAILIFSFQRFLWEYYISNF